MSKDKDLAKLTAKWYAKLKSKGFRDIEFHSEHTLKGQDARYLLDSAFRYKKRYNEFTAQHYRLVQNFCTNSTTLIKKHRFILQLYCDGIPFRKIVTECRKKGKGYGYDRNGKRNLSLFSLHHLLKRLIKEAYEWNRVDAEGLLGSNDTEASRYFSSSGFDDIDDSDNEDV